MIPKVIHYCWFGGKELPSLAVKCIKSWQKYLPDYEIRRWDESNFDVNAIPYTAEAYRQGKYAFVSDYARFWILYNHGGIYFDTDVEVLRPMNHILEKGAFFARENCDFAKNICVNPGLGLALDKHHPILRDFLDIYAGETFVNPDTNPEGKTIVEYASDYFSRRGITREQVIQELDGVTVYPEEYFSPLNAVTGRTRKTAKTVAIHHYSASWASPKKRLKGKIKRLMGQRFSLWVINTKSRLKGNGKKF